MIDEQTSGKRAAYIANDPESLIRALDRKREAVQSILPDLRGLYTTQKNKPKIKYFDGIEQMKQIYQASLEAKQILGFTSLDKFAGCFGDYANWYMAEVAKRGIFLKDVLSLSLQNDLALKFKKLMGVYYEYRSLPVKYSGIPTDMLIWDDNVAVLTLEEPVFGTILSSKALSSTFKIIHEVMWNSAQ